MSGNIDPGSNSTGGRELESIMSTLHEKKRTVSAAEWQTFCDNIADHEKFNFFMQCPATKRAFNKPRGYAGDAVLMDLLYGTDPNHALIEETNTVGREILSTLAARAQPSLLSRLGSLTTVLDGLESGASVLSVASGHGRELSDRHRHLDFSALDQDQKSLDNLSQRLPWVKTIQERVSQLITGDLALTQYDLIYASGLYDYLDETTARQLTLVLAEALSKGGELLIGNFTPEGIEVPYMESFMGWPLVRRTVQEIAHLAPSDEGFSSNVTVDEQGYVGYLTIRPALK